MPKINKKRLHPGWIAVIILLGLVNLALVITYILQGRNVALLNPKGLIAHEQYNLMIFTVIVLFAIAIPTVFLLFFIAWKYRDSNTKATYISKTKRSTLLVLSMWLIPTVVMLVLASAMLPATQKLAPQKTIAADAKPITIQVIAMRWKWLFIYPGQNIATVNFVQIPVNTPVTFELTADDTPMSSFWVPNLGGQLYAMTGHINPLNLIADTPGDYPGSTAEINGAGFSGMKFTTRASTARDFDHWVQEVRKSPDVLDEATYESLLKPSENNPVMKYSMYENDLYNKVVMKYSGPTEEQGHH